MCNYYNYIKVHHNNRSKETKLVKLNICLLLLITLCSRLIETKEGIQFFYILDIILWIINKYLCFRNDKIKIYSIEKKMQHNDQKSAFMKCFRSVLVLDSDYLFICLFFCIKVNTKIDLRQILVLIYKK